MAFRESEQKTVSSQCDSCGFQYSMNGLDTGEIKQAFELLGWQLTPETYCPSCCKELGITNATREQAAASAEKRKEDDARRLDEFNKQFGDVVSEFLAEPFGTSGDTVEQRFEKLAAETEKECPVLPREDGKHRVFVFFSHECQDVFDRHTLYHKIAVGVTEDGFVVTKGDIVVDDLAKIQQVKESFLKDCTTPQAKGTLDKALGVDNYVLEWVDQESRIPAVLAVRSLARRMKSIKEGKGDPGNYIINPDAI